MKEDASQSNDDSPFGIQLNCPSPIDNVLRSKNSSANKLTYKHNTSIIEKEFE